MKKMKSGCIKRQMEIDEIDEVGKCKLVLFFVSIFIFIKKKKKEKEKKKDQTVIIIIKRRRKLLL
jgi:hypothetical protein